MNIINNVEKAMTRKRKNVYTKTLLYGLHKRKTQARNCAQEQRYEKKNLVGNIQEAKKLFFEKKSGGKENKIQSTKY
jgi:hypothetical protein